MKKELVNKSGVPEWAIEQFARAILPSIREYYATEEGQRKFAEWQAKQKEKADQEQSTEHLNY